MSDGNEQPPVVRRGPPVWFWFLIGNAAVIAALATAGWMYLSSLRPPVVPAVVGQPKNDDGHRGEKNEPSVAEVQNSAPDRPLTVEQVVDKISRGVVLITTFNSQDQKQAIGSGFVIDARGFVATNFHVLRGASAASA